jgi:hypothetical protein
MVHAFRYSRLSPIAAANVANDPDKPLILTSIQRLLAVAAREIQSPLRRTLGSRLAASARASPRPCGSMIVEGICMLRSSLPLCSVDGAMPERHEF